METGAIAAVCDMADIPFLALRRISDDAGDDAEDQFQTVTETDTRLLKAIEASNVKELHDLFAKLGANLSKENNKTLSENLGALLDEIFKNGAKTLREAAENLVKRQQEIQKILSSLFQSRLTITVIQVNYLSEQGNSV